MERMKLYQNIKIRILDVFLNGLSTSIYIPFMGIYFASRFGEKLTGILMIFTVIIGFCAGLYAGYISDLIGRKKILQRAGLARLLGVLLLLSTSTSWIHSTIMSFIAILIITASSGMAACRRRSTIKTVP
ncbi:hypothetical protein [Heyndrickxia acidicola]|uniref:Major facilitator superfamily (MFS) profile domain-containing protein n=1 Tax=Heyndrickxia acidicola TaxID=209389 RepID=A0ABU6MS05_9BACI|nr:hypothetical protein [Heyndrickxia acidicola]MED1205815.1 hypothetical protein [Heyndrickxia acidicola]